jgi:hypothetical protein
MSVDISWGNYKKLKKFIKSYEKVDTQSQWESCTHRAGHGCTHQISTYIKEQVIEELEKRSTHPDFSLLRASSAKDGYNINFNKKSPHRARGEA